MNNGKVRPVDEALQNNFQFFPEESTNTSPRKNSLSASPANKDASKKASAAEVTASAFEPKVQATANPEQMTKKQLKKLK